MPNRFAPPFFETLMPVGFMRPVCILATAVIVIAVAVSTPSLAEQPYTVSLEGVEDGPLRDALNETSNLISLAESPPPSFVALRRRTDEDGTRLARVLAARGYLAGSVSIDIARDAQPMAVTISVIPGPRYTFSSVDVVYRGEPGPIAPEDFDLPVEADEPVLSSRIRDAAGAVVDALRGKGHAFAEVVDRRAEIDHEAHTAALTLVADAGPLARFGAVRIEGLTDLDEEVIRNRLEWERGEVFDPAKIARSRTALLDTRLLSGVKIDPEDEIGPDGELPVTVTAEEAELRSIGFGLRYSASQGAGGKIFWEHRNLLGNAETFRAEARGSFIERAFETEFVRPLFLRPDQDLRIDVQAIDEEPDAFERRSIGSTATVVRQIDPEHSARLGIGGEFSRVRDITGERSFTFASLPAGLERDTSDDLLNPTKGHRIKLSLTPFVPIGGEGTTFVKGRVDGSAYWDLSDDGSLVLAGRGSYGAIGGADLLDVPADKRFFAGGGGSIRGFAFQQAGDLDAAEDPIGGRSVVELGLELRARIGENFGIVPFIEAGRAYASATPEFDRELLVGAGLGFRYFTAIGPLRLDVGVPINKRDSDAPFQVYISLGQAF